MILLDIYPAREEQIPGITSELLLEKITCKNKSLLTPDEAITCISRIKEGVILTIGAGNIDRMIEPLKQTLISKF